DARRRYVVTQSLPERDHPRDLAPPQSARLNWTSGVGRHLLWPLPRATRFGRGIPAICNARRAFGGHGRSVTLRCLLVDDNGGFLEAARRLLERDGIDVVGVATTGT